MMRCSRCVETECVTQKLLILSKTISSGHIETTSDGLQNKKEIVEFPAPVSIIRGAENVFLIRVIISFNWASLKPPLDQVLPPSQVCNSGILARYSSISI